ncbi:unnamed protein product, partial [Meganyctiphanes norvegica]
MVSFAKYSLVPTEEPKEKSGPTKPQGAFDYTSAFSYKSAFDYGSNNASQYKSAFDYGRGPSVSLSLSDKKAKEKEDRDYNCSVMGCISKIVTGLSYFLICITFPITIWFCFKKLDQYERLIIFRLGRDSSPSIIWSRTPLKKYEIPELKIKHFITLLKKLIASDNGIVEMGCEVKYRVTDPQRLTMSVTDLMSGLRSYGKTVLLNVLMKHSIKEMERDRTSISAEIQKDINIRVQDWGIEIGGVELSTVNILKEAEPHNPLKPLMSAFGGGKGDPGAAAMNMFGGMMQAMNGNPAPVVVPSSKPDDTTINMPSLMDFSFVDPPPSKKKNEAIDLVGLYDDTNLQGPQLDNQVSGSSAPKTKLGQYLQHLVSGAGGAELSNGVFRLQVEGPEGGIFIIFIGNGVRQVVEGDLSKVTPDVAVTVTTNDLMNILTGSVSPLQTYLSGNLQVQGNIQMLMGLEALRNSSTAKDKDGSFVA